jgi:hypothetical protein
VDRWFDGVESKRWSVPGTGELVPEPTEEDIHLAGTKIAFFWDYGVTVPLWDEEGVLPDDPEWLERELGLSRGLIEDLGAWAAVQDRAGPPGGVDTQDLEEDRLFLRLQEELTPGLDVVRHW